ncbi:MBL fold metallo-hydrolase [Patescibacteria group bacterium]|nr:MBL fold metallo-hydrolase [Patescibacteria group bacterium]MBU1349972.1 MBL fold metallo-hydrolase [Patescibacteria group bacterium]MBU1421011.1 MBL fold metallo-hydrolase [Patescibacteria group bacterium]MBU1684554.1 MBL fold metallo-hydrolase [Patescibacteria group bacterium]MBU1987672.1 MBL fold metallo-hydrolase [Patescibacteria group bacterium]
MSNKLCKILLILAIIFVVIAIPTFWLLYHPTNNKLEVTFLDVNQGDAILIKTPFGQNILIDGGPDNIVLRKLKNSLPWWDKKIDLMILTHPHDDHVTGLIDVIKHYKVKRIAYTGAIHTAPNYLRWLELVKNKNIALIIIDRPQKIEFSNDCWLDVLYPTKNFLKKHVEKLNNTSIVAMLNYNQTRFLFMGDAEIEVETELLNNNIDLSANVLKIGHHGSNNSNSADFLRAVQPEIAVIQVGKNNTFGHPNRRVLKKLERLGTKIFRTDLNGTVQVISDGMNIYVK